MQNVQNVSIMFQIYLFPGSRTPAFSPAFFPSCKRRLRGFTLEALPFKLITGSMGWRLMSKKRCQKRNRIWAFARRSRTIS
jgi:hypothetical protein